MSFPPQLSTPMLESTGMPVRVWGQWFQHIWEAVSPFKKAMTAKATLDFPSVVAGTTEVLTITVTGASVNDTVAVGLPATLNDNLVFDARVTAANTVTVRAINNTAGAINPASGTYRVSVWTH